ncbi:oligoribonuclease [Oleiagrimonas sp. C23AA]|uniref:oligoribonuclease n=1 Tax=Oleiagrimonas sp. C23AA TaxID=2719047 RepID=UPI0014203454|nr:oligoribonuclease [Oleiagrimonas sp. C23AA]NII10925.1 oligoribonuclease [Oleiagrimonas sp. C23AA]
MAQAHDDNLIWIDLEMTGLDTDRDSILEIATIVTDRELNILAEGPVFAISHPEKRLIDMDDWNRNQHTKSGLWQQVLASKADHQIAEADTLAFLEQWVPAGRSPMCGNSICQDRRFLHRQMPQLERFFHYRNLDVSTLKELARRWVPSIARGMTGKASAHTALSDIRDSIDELRYYRTFMGEFGGRGAREAMEAADSADSA